MTQRGKPRRACALLTAGPGQPARPMVATRPLYSYWAILAPHFRGVLLPPHNMPDESVQWAWTVSAAEAAVSPADLATLRQRLSLAQQSLADSCEEGAETSAKTETIRATKNRMGEVVSALVALPDETFEGFVARTDHGVFLHSWGLAESLPLHYPDADFEIAGHVMVDGAPASGETVLLAAKNNRDLAQTVTDANGHFSFPRVVTGAYFVRAVSRPPEAMFSDEGQVVDVRTASVSTLEIHNEAQARKAAAPLRRLPAGRRTKIIRAVVSALLVLGAFWIRRSKVATAGTPDGNERMTWDANVAPESEAPSSPANTTEDESSPARTATARMAGGSTATILPGAVTSPRYGPADPRGPEESEERSEPPASSRHDRPAEGPMFSDEHDEQPTPSQGGGARRGVQPGGPAGSANTGHADSSNAKSIESSITTAVAGPVRGMEAQAPASGASSSPPGSTHSQARGPVGADKNSAREKSGDDSDDSDAFIPDVAARNIVVHSRSAPVYPASTWVLRTALHVSSWQPVLIRDAIVPTLPTPAGQHDAVLELRARMLAERQRAMPGTLQAARIVVGIRIEFALPEDSPPRWDLTGGEAPLTATAGRSAAEIAWRSGLPTGQFDLNGADGRAIARISADKIQGIRVSSVEPIFSWPWISIECATGEEGRFRWQTFGTATQPPSWSASDQKTGKPGQRLDLRLPTGLDETVVLKVALVDESTGWALSGMIEQQQRAHR